MFIMGLLSPLPMITLLLDRLFLVIHNRFLILMESLDNIANSPWINGSFPLVFAMLYYVIFCFLMISLSRGHLLQAFKYGLTLTLFITIILLRPYFSPLGSVTMLDIGQGDSFIIELPYRIGVILIYAGAPFYLFDMELTIS